MTNPTRTPWNAGNGCMPQLFRIDDIVHIRQDGSASAGWAADLGGIQLRILGAMKDGNHVCYRVCLNDRAMDCLTLDETIPEDWLETCVVDASCPTERPPARSSDRAPTPATPTPPTALAEALERIAR